MRVLPSNAVSWLVFIAGMVAAAYLLWPDARLSVPARAPRAVTTCSGCGSEWRAMYDGPMEPITQCPNCPMSEEEFERLKESIKRRIEKGEK